MLGSSYIWFLDQTAFPTPAYRSCFPADLHYGVGLYNRWERQRPSFCCKGVRDYPHWGSRHGRGHHCYGYSLWPWRRTEWDSALCHRTRQRGSNIQHQSHHGKSHGSWEQFVLHVNQDEMLSSVCVYAQRAGSRCWERWIMRSVVDATRWSSLLPINVQYRSSDWHLVPLWVMIRSVHVSHWIEAL